MLFVNLILLATASAASVMLKIKQTGKVSHDSACVGLTWWEDPALNQYLTVVLKHLKLGSLKCGINYDQSYSCTSQKVKWICNKKYNVVTEEEMG